MELSFSLAFIAGLVSFLSPCVLPLVPAYIGYMGGRVTYTVAAQAGTAQVAQPTLSSRVSTITHGLAFVGGFTFVFVALGLLGTAFIQQIGARNLSFVTDIIGRVGGVMIIFFGLHFMGVVPALFRRLLTRSSLTSTPVFSIAFAIAVSALVLWAFVDWLIALPIIAIILLWMFLGGAFTQPQAFWQRAIASIQRALYADTRRQMVAKGQQSYASSALMGVVFSAGWTPCIGPIYGAILTMALTNNDIAQAGGLLVAYSLGLGVPFLLTAALLDSAQTILRGFQRHLRKVELVSGAFLIAIGLLVASGSMQNMSRVFSTQFADFSYRLEECVLELNEGRITIGQFIGCVNADTRAAAAEAAVSAPEAALESAPSILDLAGAASAEGVERTVGTAIGSLAPDFQTVSAGGEPFTLSDHRGEVVLLNFWATWCGPCREEMPVFENAYQRQADDGLLIVGVNFDESARDVSNFGEEFGLSFPLVLDEGGDIQKLYGVRAYPTTYLIDRDGAIIAYHAGPLSELQIQNLIRDALA